MRYLGGKSRIAKQLAEVIDSVRHPGQWVWDAFCGGLSMSVALRKKGPVWSTDANAALIALYQAVQNGWEPPTEVSREDHQAAKVLPDTDPRKALMGFGSSFGGMWFGSYAGGKNGPLTYAQLAARNVKASTSKLNSFSCVDFLSVQPQSCEAILYLDPPYAGTAGYAATGPFDHEAFIRRVREWSRWTHVFVSEYSFPIGECIWARASTGTFGRYSGKAHTERLYYIGPTTELT